MIFNSFGFLVFFPIVVIVYFSIKSNKWRNLFLLAASYYFYMCWKPVYALLLLTSTAVTYLASLGIEKYKKNRNAFLISSIFINLCILFFFKYFNWAAENITALMDLFGIKISIPAFNVLLPVGISFYIFQALGYTLDVHRGEIKPEKNFFTYALFVSFFPQLVAGPIERSTNLLRQFYEKHKFDGERAIRGMQLMLWGFFLKLVIADNLANYVNLVYNDIDGKSGGEILIASVLFCFQLYGDFAGYSYIAIGAASIMGFKLMDNFRRPYFFSTSIQEYWKRNHISLTSWFMDYIYYPLVGDSIKLWWWCCAIFITFFISGFWHGAAWTYVICFSIHGIYLVVCTLKDKRQKKFEKKYNLKKKEWWKWLNRFVTFILIMLSLVFFRANSLNDGFYAINRIFTDMFDGLLIELFYQKFKFGIVLLLFIIEYFIEYKKTSFVERHFLTSHIVMGVSLLLMIVFMGEFEGNQFIYFQF